MPPLLCCQAVRSMERNFTLEATQPHFDLVNHQLRQLRVLFALGMVGTAPAWLGEV